MRRLQSGNSGGSSVWRSVWPGWRLGVMEWRIGTPRSCCGATEQASPASRRADSAHRCFNDGHYVADRLRWRGVQFLIWFRHRSQIELLIQLHKNAALAAFHNETVRSRAAQKNTAFRSIKRKKIRFAEQIRSLRMLFLQQFGVLAEEPGCVYLT